MDIVFGGGERTGRENTELATYEAVANPELKKYTLVMMKYVYMTAFAGVFTAFTFIANAQDFDKGLAFSRNGDFAAAVKEWRPLAEQGHAVAQYNLGVMYDNGEGVSKDAVEAVRWYRLAAKQGYSFAQYNLGLMYANGDGVSKDAVEAVRWFRLAAEQGVASAQFNLGVMYNTGDRVSKDAVEAVRWFRLAAAQGHTRAQFNLGVVYANGEGVLKDAVTAHMWYNISSASGHESAGKLRDELETNMTPEQIADAVQRAKTCMSSNYAQCD
ncbi:tetratricopeptide repeat protein [Profundibacter sp.]